MWKECNEIQEKGEGFDEEKTKLIMQDAYEGFIEYLEKEKKPSSYSPSRQDL